MLSYIDDILQICAAISNMQSSNIPIFQYKFLNSFKRDLTYIKDSWNQLLISKNSIIQAMYISYNTNGDLNFWPMNAAIVMSFLIDTICHGRSQADAF